MKSKGKVMKKILNVLLLFCCGMVSTYFAAYSSNFSASKIEAGKISTKKELLPGEVGLSKTATPVPNMVNQWDIKLRIEARNQFPPPATDVVLIFDTSGSMNEAGTDGIRRMDKAKAATEKFVQQVLKDGYINRIALVTYNTSITNHTFTDAGWSGQFVDSEHRGVLIDTIRGLEAKGGTHTQGGITAATELMKKATTARRHIVLVSDGVPTYSYPPLDPYNSMIGMEKFNHPNPDIASKYTTYQRVKTIPETHFVYDDSRTVGIGANYFSAGEAPNFQMPTDSSNRVYANHANSAIAQASIAKAKKTASGEKLVTDFYTIGVDLDLQSSTGEVQVGNQTMKEIASSEEKCFSVSSDDLAKIMTEIGGKIVGAVKEATIVDPLGKGFTLAGNIGNSNASQGKISISSDQKTMIWEVGSLTVPVSSDPNEDIMFAEFTYRINATQEILTLNALDGNGEAPTNGRTTIKYKDYDDNETMKDFVVPKVKPIIVSLEKKLFDAKGNAIVNSTDAFNVNYGSDLWTTQDQFLIYPNDQLHRVVHPWKAGTNYSVEELLTGPQKYETEIKINNQVTAGTNATFAFNKNAAGDYVHQQIVITNKKLIEKKTIYLNIRQSVVSSHEELVVPSKGYFKGTVDKGNKQVNLVSGSTVKNTPSEIEENLFTKYEMTLLKDESYFLLLKDIVPEYYRFYGFVATKSADQLKTKHVSANTADLVTVNEAKLDYETVDTYWVTMFITPKFGRDSNQNPEESPRPFSWSYKTNDFGH